MNDLGMVCIDLYYKMAKVERILLLAIPRRLFCSGSLVILYVVCRYLSLFLLYMYKNRS